jgi:hypothetical protein
MKLKTCVCLLLAVLATANGFPITEVTGDNFSSEIMESSKDTLLLVYVPWHPYSERLFSAMRELEESMVDNKKLSLAINDGDASPITHPWKNTNLVWFSMYLFKNGRKEMPVDYDVENKGHALQDLKKFLSAELDYTNQAIVLAADSGLPQLSPPFYKK